MACCVRRRMLRDGPGGLLDGSLVYCFGGWFETGPPSCPTALSWRFVGGFDSRRARRLARRLARGASAEDSIRDGSGVLSDGSLVALWRMVRSRLARCLARRLTRIGLVRQIVRRIRCLLNGSRDNSLTCKIRKGICSHTRPCWVRAGARSYSSWSV